jgi:hypothetical protein
MANRFGKKPQASRRHKCLGDASADVIEARYKPRLADLVKSTRIG